MEVEIVQNRLGGEALVFQGYVYTKNGAGSRTRYYYKCNEKQALKCKGSISTLKDPPYADPRVVSAHCHASETAHVERIKLNDKIRQKAKSTRENPANILGELVPKASEDLQRILPPQKHLKRNIQRYRQKPPVPADLTGIY